jgi:hypothetical protein
MSTTATNLAFQQTKLSDLMLKTKQQAISLNLISTLPLAPFYQTSTAFSRKAPGQMTGICFCRVSFS